MTAYVILAFVALARLSITVGQDLEPFAQKVGSAFCMYLAYKSILPRKYFNLCGPPTCGWDDWQDALTNTSNSFGASPNQRIVVSYSHNGFGNQLWEHSVAFMVAESLKARLLIAIIPDNLSPGGFIPPNTWSGMSAMERLLPSEFLYESLPTDSPIRSLCDNETFFASDRPYDWRSKNYTQNFRPQLHEILTDSKPRCLKLLGYFQNLPLCQDDARRLWMNRMISNFTMRPGDNDISIYLRCIPRHYHFNDAHFYESILNHTSFDRIWLFQAPECPNKLSDNPAKDSLVTSVVRMLRERFNATRWPSYEGPDDTKALLHDLAGLAMSKKLILPLSSWAFWAGMLSNATEIHVNAPPLHPLMPHNTQYIYHDEKHRMYFGRYNASANDIEYEIRPDAEWTPSMAQHLRNRGQGHSSNHSLGEGHHSHHNRHGGNSHGKHGHGHGHDKQHAKSHGKTGGHKTSDSPTIAVNGSSNAKTVDVNVTMSLEIMSDTTVVDKFSYILSSCETGLAIKPTGEYMGLNRSALNEAAHKLIFEGTLPLFSQTTSFDVKSTLTVAVCKCSESILLESYTISSNSLDLRSDVASQNASAVVNKDAVAAFTKSILSSSVIFGA